MSPCLAFVTRLLKHYNKTYSRSFYIMNAFFTLFKGLPVLATCVVAAASYPPIPADLTTPVQQRIAINGPNGEFVGYMAYINLSPSLLTPD